MGEPVRANEAIKMEKEKRFKFVWREDSPHFVSTTLFEGPLAHCQMIVR